jgi:hypothetical protein
MTTLLSGSFSCGTAGVQEVVGGVRDGVGPTAGIGAGGGRVVKGIVEVEGVKRGSDLGEELGEVSEPQRGVGDGVSL